MPGYYALLKKAVSKLPDDDVEGRKSIYERSRFILSDHLNKANPPLSDIDAASERKSLESAIAHVEAEYKQKPSASQASAEGWSRQSAAQIGGQKNARSKLKSGMSGILFIAALLAIGLVPALLISLGFRGNDWLVERLLAYLVGVVPFVMAACLIVLAPLAVAEATRAASVFGLLAASYFFGVTTWLLAFEATLQFAGRLWIFGGLFMGVVGIVPIGILACGTRDFFPDVQYVGRFWIFLGLFMGVVGIVPVGILASGSHNDFQTAGVLVGGLILTFGIRSAALALAETKRTY